MNGRHTSSIVICLSGRPVVSLLGDILMRQWPMIPSVRQRDNHAILFFMIFRPIQVNNPDATQCGTLTRL
jgi:hypothetical protein